MLTWEFRSYLVLIFSRYKRHHSAQWCHLAFLCACTRLQISNCLKSYIPFKKCQSLLKYVVILVGHLYSWPCHFYFNSCIHNVGLPVMCNSALSTCYVIRMNQIRNIINREDASHQYMSLCMYWYQIKVKLIMKDLLFYGLVVLI